MDGITEDVWMCLGEEGITCYQSDAKCIRAGECINGVERESLILPIDGL